jgi:lactoylglutathione lyase
MKDWNARQPSIVFECEDVERTLEELASRGVETGGQPVSMAWGKFGTFKDLDGNEFGLKTVDQKLPKPRQRDPLDT